MIATSAQSFRSGADITKSEKKKKNTYFRLLIVWGRS